MDAGSPFSEPHLMDFNNRELALLTWIAIGVAAILLSKKIRPSALDVPRALFQRKIVAVLGSAIIYTGVSVWLLAQIGVWGWANLKTTIFWYLGTAFVAMADVRKLKQGPVTLVTIAKDTFAMSAAILFLASMETLPFWAEFVMLPVLTVLGVIVVMAERDPEHHIIIAPINTLLTLAGFCILAYSIYQVILGWQGINIAFQGRDFAVPIFLTLMFLPFLYGLMVYMGIENASVALHFRIEDRALRRYAMRRGILAFGASVSMFQRYMQALRRTDIVDRQSVDSVVATLRRARKREKRPPSVAWEDGWAPHLARDFLKDHGLQTEPYHASVVDWSAASPYVNLNDEVLPDRIVYRISGNEFAVTEVELALHVNVSDHAQESDEQFWTIGSALILEILGGETTERFNIATPADAALRIEAGKVVISVERDDWDTGHRRGYRRAIKVRHPAYCAPFVVLT
jgi:hypothetical protein